MKSRGERPLEIQLGGPVLENNIMAFVEIAENDWQSAKGLMLGGNGASSKVALPVFYVVRVI